MTQRVRILLIEDSIRDATLIERAIQNCEGGVDLERVEDAAELRLALTRGPWQAILCAWATAGCSAMEALAILSSTELDLPFIIISPPAAEDAAAEAMRAGAHDYVLKDNLRRLAPALDREIAESRSRQAGRQAEEAHRMLFDASPMPMYLFDAETFRFLAVNQLCLEMYGYTREELLGMGISQVRTEGDIPAALRSGADQPHWTGSVSHRRKNGDPLTVEINSRALSFGDRPARLVVVRDVTDRQRVEDQLRQAQKMEAVGRLAGGLAHDFNNLLTLVLSYGAIVLADLQPNEPMYGDIEEILKAGRMAAGLTRQLLMFSRQQVLEPKVIDLNETLAGIEKMLRRMVGEDVELVCSTKDPLGKVFADPGSIEQVIMNLAMNARDAMPVGGRLTIETASLVLDEEFAREHLGAPTGPCTMLTVADTGTGMDPATQSRIFEPFFTTKPAAKGTGLGLSTVYGIVYQAGGCICVDSERGKGTRFRIYLPSVARDEEKPAPVTGTAMAQLRGAETILVVEDDPQVRTVVCAILRRSGYNVIAAANAGEALLSLESHPDRIDLLLTDVVMPLMSGPELIKRVARSHPETKALCMSGYTDDSIVRHGVLAAEIAYLQKPLTPEALNRKVREVLDRSSP